MKAIQLQEKDKDLVLIEVAAPAVIEGKTIINVKDAALNHRDLWIVKGKYARIKYPIIPGSDLCGYAGDKRVVVNPGFFWGENENVQSKEFQILGLPEDGSLAELVSVRNDYIYEAPQHLNDAEAAALPLAGVTAYRALFTKCKPEQGENILITGIGGGVALQVLQFAVAFGLNVFVSSSDEDKIQKAIALGAKGGVNYKNDNWDKELNELSGGVHIIIDSAAGNGFSKFPNVCLPGARICLYGGTQGVISELSPQSLFWKQISIYGSVMGTQSEFKSMLDFVTLHKIVPVVDKIYRMSEAKEAFERMNRKEQFGKIVLNISQ